MAIQRLRTLALACLLSLVVVLGACTRSVSTPPPSGGTGELTPELLAAQQATMEAVRSALLTQTAIAAGSSIQLPSPLPSSTPTPELATATPTLTSTPEGPSPTGGGPSSTPTATLPASQSGQYTVQPGEWVYSIAKKFAVDPDELIRLNNLQHPYVLQPGQVLTIPVPATPSSDPTLTPLAGGTTYVVQPGEWVYSIARKFGVDPLRLIELNNLAYPYVIYPGQILNIP